MVRVVIHESIVFFFCRLYKFLISWNIQSESSMLLIWSTGVIMVKIYQVAFVSIISIHFIIYYAQWHGLLEHNLNVWYVINRACSEKMLVNVALVHI